MKTMMTFEAFKRQMDIEEPSRVFSITYQPWLELNYVDYIGGSKIDKWAVAEKFKDNNLQYNFCVNWIRKQ